jgi:hypothetical protein
MRQPWAAAPLGETWRSENGQKISRFAQCSDHLKPIVEQNLFLAKKFQKIFPPAQI